MKEKAERVILSCITESQLESAYQYLILFFNKTQDLSTLRELMSVYNDKLDQLHSN